MKPKDAHPLSREAELSRLWQTKHGELCNAMHEAATHVAFLVDPATPAYLRALIERDLPKLHETIGRLAMQAGPSAFRECWKKSRNLTELLDYKSVQARVFEAVEEAWRQMTALRSDLTSHGTGTVASCSDVAFDFHKAGLRERTHRILEKDPGMANWLGNHPDEFHKLFRRALKHFQLQNLPASRAGKALRRSR